MTGSMSRKPVLVLGCHVSGLAAIRSLGRLDVPVVALSYESTDFAQYSRYVMRSFNVPHPGLDPQSLLGWFGARREEYGGALIIDTDDHGAEFVSKNKDVLTEGYRVATADWSQASYFLDKSKAWELADRMGVPHPLNLLPTTEEEMEWMAGRVRYPCVLKPVEGHKFFEQFRFKMFEVHSAEEAMDRFRRCAERGHPVMLQEVIPGPETNLVKLELYSDSRGEVRGKFFWRKIRQHPPMFGVGRVGISIEPDAKVEELALRMLRGAGYEGYCNMEFKWDERDNQYKFIEANVRQPRQGAFSTAAGVNMPWIIYQDRVEEEHVVTNGHEVGLHYIESITDFYNALFNHSREHFTVREYLAPYFAKRKVFAVWSVEDWRPFVRQLWVTLRRAFAR